MRRFILGGITLAVMTLIIGAEEQKAGEKIPDTGLKIGDPVPAYNPIHVAGPDAGTNTCPV